MLKKSLLFFSPWFPSEISITGLPDECGTCDKVTFKVKCTLFIFFTECLMETVSGMSS